MRSSSCTAGSAVLQQLDSPGGRHPEIPRDPLSRFALQCLWSMFDIHVRFPAPQVTGLEKLGHN